MILAPRYPEPLASMAKKERREVIQAIHRKNLRLNLYWMLPFIAGPVLARLSHGLWFGSTPPLTVTYSLTVLLFIFFWMFAVMLVSNHCLYMPLLRKVAAEYFQDASPQGGEGTNGGRGRI